MNYVWIVILVVFAIFDNLAKAQKRAEDARNRQERMMAERAVKANTQQQQGPQQLERQQAQPLRRAPVTWREPGRWSSQPKGATAGAGAPPATGTRSLGGPSDTFYSGSMKHVSGEGRGVEGMTSHEWDLPPDHPDWELGGEEPGAGRRSAAVNATAWADDAASQAMRMLSGGAGQAAGAATAIVLAEVIGRPRAYRPWQVRRGGPHAMT